MVRVPCPRSGPGCSMPAPVTPGTSSHSARAGRWSRDSALRSTLCAGVDRPLLPPLLDQCRDQPAAAGIRPKLRTVLADSRYVSEENFARADQDKLRLLAPLAKDPARRGGHAPKRARHLEQYPATGRAIRRMRHPRGREDYKLRARTVEPVAVAEDLPETDHHVPARPGRMRKRMAAGLHRA